MVFCYRNRNNNMDTTFEGTLSKGDMMNETLSNTFLAITIVAYWIAVIREFIIPQVGKE